MDVAGRVAVARLAADARRRDLVVGLDEVGHARRDDRVDAFDQVGVGVHPSWRMTFCHASYSVLPNR